MRPHNTTEGDTTPGLRLFPRDVRTLESFGCNQQPSLCLRSHRHLLSNGPHEGTQFPGNGDHDLMGIFAVGHQVAIPLTEPALGFPADRLERGGELCQAQWEVTTDLGRIPVRPGAPTRGGHARMLICESWSCHLVDDVPPSHIPRV